MQKALMHWGSGVNSALLTSRVTHVAVAVFTLIAGIMLLFRESRDCRWSAVQLSYKC